MRTKEALTRSEAMYYPLVRQAEFESVDAMCCAIGVSAESVAFHVDNARIESSELVVCDSIALGDPENRVRAVLALDKIGRVTLWAGFFGEISGDPTDVEHFLVDLGLGEEKSTAIGEVRGRGHRPLN